MATEQAPTTPAHATATPDASDGPAVIPERDYAKLLVTDDEPAKPDDEVETPAVMDKAEPVADEKVEATATTDTAPEQKEPEATAPAEPTEPKPGTPDKALQKLQQDLSAATRQLATLQEKVEAGEKLTPKEQATVQTATRKLDAVRASLKDKGEKFDVLEDGIGAAIAQTLDEQDRTVQQLHQELTATKAEVAEMRKATAEQQRASQWRETEEKYPKVNVREVWDKAANDAVEASGFTVEEINADPKLAKAIGNVATRTFHERAEAASKSIAAKAPVPPPQSPADKKPPTTRTATPVTPGGARVAQSSGVSTTSEPDDYTVYRNRARALVTSD